MNIIEPVVYKFSKSGGDCSLLVLAAGFEDRAFAFLNSQKFSKKTYCIIVNFKYNVEGNEKYHQKFLDKLKDKVNLENLINVELRQDSIGEFEDEFSRAISEIPYLDNEIWFDISGVPSYAICMVLKQLRGSFSKKDISLFYTSAEKYFPTEEEITKITENLGADVEYLSPTMAMEMAEVLLLESFSGHRSNEGKSCLAVFAGYDASRSSGIIESINPATLLLIYGKPGDSSLDWRLSLSKKLHSRFEGNRRSATEDVSTLSIKESLAVLEEYYKYLVDDFDFTVAPVCSKMQSVAIYLFWEKYKEVQLVFPLPIGYSLDKKPKGVGCTYHSILKPLSFDFWQLNELD